MADPFLTSPFTREDPTEGKKKSVLICDDQEDILYITAASFKNKYNILTAKSGAECLRVVDEENAKGNEINIVLLDYKLGDMTGDEIARVIKRNKQADNTKIVLTTAFEVDDAFLSKMREDKLIDAELKKPFAMADLRKLVTQLIG